MKPSTPKSQRSLAEGAVALSPAEAKRRAAALVPKLIERARTCEEIGRCPDETIADLRESGLLRMMQPARFGGAELSAEPVLEVMLELCRGCPSTAWVFVNLVTHSWNIGQFPLQAQEDVWAHDPDAVAATGLAFPCGRAIPVEGGYRLTGRWPFASGVDASSWMLVGAMVQRDGEPERRMFLIPQSDFRSLGNWRAYGLAGTGSHDVEIKDAFVPAHRTLAADVFASGITPGAKVNPAPVFRLPPFASFPFFLAMVPLGTARAAVEEFLAAARKRVATYSGARVADHVPVQMRLAEASAAVDLAELSLRTDLRALVSIIESGGQPSLEDKIRWRRNLAFVAQLCVRAVDSLMAASGGGGILLTNPIQARFRDVHAAAAHISMTWDVQATLYGQNALGIAIEGLVI